METRRPTGIRFFSGMMTACALLSVASFVFLGVYLALEYDAWRGRADIPPLVIMGMAWTGILFHFCAWVSLYHVLYGHPEDRGSTIGMEFAFGGSVVAFCVVVGIIFALRDPYVGLIAFLGVFPLVPLVFAPVSIAHSILFLIARTRISKRGPARLVASGAIILFALSVAALILSVATDSEKVLSLAGFTGVGYGAIAEGWRLERIAASTRRIIVFARPGSRD